MSKSSSSCELMRISNKLDDARIVFAGYGVDLASFIEIFQLSHTGSNAQGDCCALSSASCPDAHGAVRSQSLGGE
jgi:hypothetical protein